EGRRRQDIKSGRRGQGKIEIDQLFIVPAKRIDILPVSFFRVVGAQHEENHIRGEGGAALKSGLFPVWFVAGGLHRGGVDAEIFYQIRVSKKLLQAGRIALPAAVFQVSATGYAVSHTGDADRFGTEKNDGKNSRRAGGAKTGRGKESSFFHRQTSII